MNSLKKELPFLLLLLLLFVSPSELNRLFPLAVENEGPPVTPREVAITEARARAVAQKLLPQADHLKTELEHEKGAAVYEVTLVKEHQQKVFLIDAHQGTSKFER